MGIGAVFLAFGSVILVIAFVAHTADAQRNIATMITTALGALLGGAILFGGGFLLRRGKEKPAGATASSR